MFPWPFSHLTQMTSRESPINPHWYFWSSFFHCSKTDCFTGLKGSANLCSPHSIPVLQSINLVPYRWKMSMVRFYFWLKSAWPFIKKYDLKIWLLSWRICQKWFVLVMAFRSNFEYDPVPNPGQNLSPSGFSLTLPLIMLEWILLAGSKQCWKPGKGPVFLFSWFFPNQNFADLWQR